MRIYSGTNSKHYQCEMYFYLSTVRYVNNPAEHNCHSRLVRLLWAQRFWLQSRFAHLPVHKKKKVRYRGKPKTRTGRYVLRKVEVTLKRSSVSGATQNCYRMIKLADLFFIAFIALLLSRECSCELYTVELFFRIIPNT